MAEVRRILFINVSRIGDTLLSTPALRAIALAHPGAEIDCLGHPNRVEIMAHLPGVKRVGGITKNSVVWRRCLAALIRQARYDLAFVFGFDQSLVRYALQVASKVYAFRQADESINRRLATAVPVPGFQEDHAVLQLLRLPQAAGIAPAGLRLSYCVTAEEKAWAAARLARSLPADQGPVIGLQVASFPTKAYRDWPIEHFMALTERVLARWPSAHFLIFGGSEEKERTQRLAEKLGRSGTLLAGQLTLRQTVAMMSCTNLYVGVDTGPTHLMSALDIPLIGLYHCYSPSRLIGPLEHPLAYIIDHPRNDGSCGMDTPMAEISVDMVMSRVEQALAGQPATSSAS